MIDEDMRAQRRLGKILKGLRMRKRFSQRSFAKHIGLDRSYYNKVERGKADLSFRILRRICKGLGIPMGKLFLRIEKHLN